MTVLARKEHLAVDLALPMAAERLIPHRPPMRLVDELLECRNRGGVAAATVTADGPLTAADGCLEAVGLVEMMAQSYAAIYGYEDLRLGRPVKEGFLVGIRALRIEGTARVGDRLLIQLRTTAELDGFAVAEGEILRGTEVIAAGTLKLWIPPAAAAAEGN
jgi:predicted hotdog family 3-hydroxylacyl-ACP dehydratase